MRAIQIGKLREHLIALFLVERPRLPAECHHAGELRAAPARFGFGGCDQLCAMPAGAMRFLDKKVLYVHHIEPERREQGALKAPVAAAQCDVEKLPFRALDAAVEGA